MWASHKPYEAEIRQLEAENSQLRNRVAELEDDSGYNTVQRLKSLAKELNIDMHSDEWQDMAQTIFMNIGGRHLPILRGYSGGKYVADLPPAIREELERMMQKKNPLKQVEHKK